MRIFKVFCIMTLISLVSIPIAAIFLVIAILYMVIGPKKVVREIDFSNDSLKEQVKNLDAVLNGDKYVVTKSYYESVREKTGMPCDDELQAELNKIKLD